MLGVVDDWFYFLPILAKQFVESCLIVTSTVMIGYFFGSFPYFLKPLLKNLLSGD